MKRLAIGVVAIVAVLFLAGAVIVHYVRPAEPLDLTYQDVSAFDKVADMLVRRQPILELNADDVNNLLKRAVSEHAVLSASTAVTGAKFVQRGDLLEADITVSFNGKVPVGVHLQYALQADGPVLTARFLNAHIRDWEVPPGWLDAPDFTVDLNSYMPSAPIPIAVKQVELADNVIRLHLGLR